MLFVAFDAARFLIEPAARSFDASAGQAEILQTLDTGATDPRVFVLGDKGSGTSSITTPLNATHW